MTLVLDASVLVELLLSSERGEQAIPYLRKSEGRMHIPHLADIETASVLRGLTLGGAVAVQRASAALADLPDFPAKRWPTTVFLERIWELRENVTAYDANYIALAESLDAELLTSDAKLAGAAEGVARCEITLLGR